MIKFRKLLILKIVSLVVAITFFVTSSAYGIDLPKKSHLRAPLLGNSEEGKKRLDEALSHVVSNEGASPERFVFDNVDSMIKWIEENVEGNPDILVLPHLWFREWETNKNNFSKAIKDFIRNVPYEFPEPNGPAAVSVFNTKDGGKRYAVILSEFSPQDYHPGDPGGSTTVYHATPIGNALSVS